MNIRNHISRRRQSERVMYMRHKRLLSLEINRKIILQSMATRNIDKQMETIQKELIEMRNPSRNKQRKKRYKFPVPSPIWKRCKPPQETHNSNSRRNVLLLKSFDDNDDDDDNDNGNFIELKDLYQRWSTSETLLLFNKDKENEENAAYCLTNSQSVHSEESNFSLKTDSTSQLENKTSSFMVFEQSDNSVSLSSEPPWQSNVTEKPLVIFSPEKTSSFAGQFVQGNYLTKNAKERDSLQAATDEIPQAGTLLPLPPIRHNGAAAAAVIESPEQFPSPTRILRLRSTADASLPVAITQEDQHHYHQQLNSQSQNHFSVGGELETESGKRGTVQCYYNYPTEEDLKNSTCNKQESLFSGVTDFATLARTSMSSIKNDIARRLSTTAAPTELKKLQWQRNGGPVPKNRVQSLSINPDLSSSENTNPSSRASQMLSPKHKESDKRRKSEGGDILGTTASLRRLSLYTPREEPPITALGSKSSESDTGLRVNKSKAEEKPRRKSYLKSLPVYDRELYNPDGSLRTVYCLPSFDECWEQAQQARYIRTREVMDRDKELTVDEVFAKHVNIVEESGTEK